jgi:hypothetical protein
MLGSRRSSGCTFVGVRLTARDRTAIGPANCCVPVSLMLAAELRVAPLGSVSGDGSLSEASAGLPSVSELAWAALKPVFDAEIAKCRNANFEFSTLSASYVANLDFMSHEWLVANVKRLFPIEFPANFKAAIGGLAYATPTRPIYQLLATNGVLEAAFRTKLEDRHNREKIVQWICLDSTWRSEHDLRRTIFASR